MSSKLLTLADVADALNVSAAQAYALVRDGRLRAVKIGGRGQWRVASDDLSAYLDLEFVRTAEFVRAHPFREPFGISAEFDDRHGGERNHSAHAEGGQ